MAVSGSPLFSLLTAPILLSIVLVISSILLVFVPRNRAKGMPEAKKPEKTKKTGT